MTGRTPQDVSHKTSKINREARETQFRWDQLWDKPQHQLETTAVVQNVSIKSTTHFTKLSLLFKNSPGEGISFPVAIISPRVNRLCKFKGHVYLVFSSVTCVCHEGSFYSFVSLSFFLSKIPCKCRSMRSSPYKSTTLYIQLNQDISTLSQGSKSLKHIITLCTSDGASIYPQEFIKMQLNCLITTDTNE